MEQPAIYIRADEFAAQNKSLGQVRLARGMTHLVQDSSAEIEARQENVPAEPEDVPHAVLKQRERDETDDVLIGFIDN